MASRRKPPTKAHEPAAPPASAATDPVVPIAPAATRTETAVEPLILDTHADLLLHGLSSVADCLDLSFVGDAERHARLVNDAEQMQRFIQELTAALRRIRDARTVRPAAPDAPSEFKERTAPHLDPSSGRADFAGFAQQLRDEIGWSNIIHPGMDGQGQGASDRDSLQRLLMHVELVGKRQGFM